MMNRLKSLRLVVSHLYRKLEEYGQDYDKSVISMKKQECECMGSQRHVSPAVEESDESEHSEESDSSGKNSDDSIESNMVMNKNTTSCISQPPGQKITIDNINYRQQVHYMTQEHQTVDKHYLTVCATTNRVHGNHMSSTQPTDLLKSMDNGKCIPSHADQITQRDNYITLMSYCKKSSLYEWIQRCCSTPHTTYVSEGSKRGYTISKCISS